MSNRSRKMKYFITHIIHSFLRNISWLIDRDIIQNWIEKKLLKSPKLLLHQKAITWLWIQGCVEKWDRTKEYFVSYNFHHGDLIHYYHYFHMRNAIDQNIRIVNFGGRNENEIKNLFFKESDPCVQKNDVERLFNLFDKSDLTFFYKVSLKLSIRDMMVYVLREKKFKYDQGDLTRVDDLDRFRKNTKHPNGLETLTGYASKSAYVHQLENNLPREKASGIKYNLNTDKETDLLKNLGIQDKYICVHLREVSPFKGLPRSVQEPDNYIPGLKYLIQKGYQIVLMGTPFKDLSLNPYRNFSDDRMIHYYQSSEQSVMSDALLIKNCKWMVCSFSGVLAYMVMFRKPVLALNCAFLAFSHLFEEYRYYPKYFYKNGQELSPEEYLSTSAIYDQEGLWMQEQGITYKEMQSDEINEAIQEFESIFYPTENFKEKTPLQKKFDSLLKPEHFFMQGSKAAPLNCYLKRFC